MSLLRVADDEVSEGKDVSGNLELVYGSEPIFWVDVGEYEGESIVVFKHPNGGYDLIEYDYGSCEYCDPWMNSIGRDERVEYLQGLVDEAIHYETLEEVAKGIDDKDARKKFWEEMKKLELE